MGVFFFFNDTATTEIYTLSLHDALPISGASFSGRDVVLLLGGLFLLAKSVLEIHQTLEGPASRSEEHTSELQSRSDLVCRLLLEKKKKRNMAILHHNKSILQRVASRGPA